MQFSKAIVRSPGLNFCDGVTEAELGAPDFQLAISQHKDYCQALESCGVEVISLDADPAFPDCCFVEDTAIIVGDTAVVTRLGHPTRQGEEKGVGEILRRFKRIGQISIPGTVDGGDVMRVGNHYFIGISKRTNREGALQLSEIVNKCGMTSTCVAVEEFIHLKTAVSSVNDETIVGLSACINDACFEIVRQKIAVAEEEHWAANCVSANGFALVPSNCPKTKSALESIGLKVLTVDTSEFQKMDGRLTCLSILF